MMPCFKPVVCVPGFPNKVVEAFWLGFPEDWQRVIASYFNKEEWLDEPTHDGRNMCIHSFINLCWKKVFVYLFRGNY